MDWDWEAQRRETEEAVGLLAAQTKLPLGTEVWLEIHSVPNGASSPDVDAYADALQAAGFEVFDDHDTIEARCDARFEAESIWKAEARATEIALAHGFRPDGWAFHALPIPKGRHRHSQGWGRWRAGARPGLLSVEQVVQNVLLPLIDLRRSGQGRRAIACARQVLSRSILVRSTIQIGGCRP